jgi:phosphatidylglycerophosphate synthase
MSVKGSINDLTAVGIDDLEELRRLNKRIITVPNFLSLSRALFLPILYVLIHWNMPVAFLIGYIILGATDFFDGIIARKFNQKSDIGKVLDSVADVCFYLSTAWFIHALYPEYIAANNMLLKVFFAAFFLSLAASVIFCKKPILMHTYILKLNAVLVYLLMIFSYFFDTTIMLGAILVLYIIGFAEEIYIFARHGEVDPDSPFFWKIKKLSD